MTVAATLKKEGPPKRAFELQLADERDQAVLV